MKPHVLLALVLVAVSCDSQIPQSTPPREVSPHKLDTKQLQFRSSNSYNWCDVFSCDRCPTSGPCPPAGTESIIHCCNEIGICYHVELATMCDPDEFVVICRWGQTNPDGSITCYE